MVAPAKGTGVSPFGTSAYGYGTPVQAPIQGGAVYADARGVQQNTPLLLEPVATGSQSYALVPGSPKLHYIYNSFGRKIGAPDVVHMATLAMATVRGTSIDPNLGHTFADIRKITDSFENDMRSKVDEVFAEMVDRRLIRVESVTTTPGNGSPALVRVMLTDLTTQEPIELSA